MLGSAEEVLRNAEECWGVLGTTEECWGVLGSAG